MFRSAVLLGVLIAGVLPAAESPDRVRVALALAVAANVPAESPPVRPPVKPVPLVRVPDCSKDLAASTAEASRRGLPLVVWVGGLHCADHPELRDSLAGAVHCHADGYLGDRSPHIAVVPVGGPTTWVWSERQLADAGRVAEVAAVAGGLVNAPAPVPVAAPVAARVTRSVGAADCPDGRCPNARR